MTSVDKLTLGSEPQKSILKTRSMSNVRRRPRPNYEHRVKAKLDNLKLQDLPMPAMAMGDSSPSASGSDSYNDSSSESDEGESRGCRSRSVDTDRRKSRSNPNSPTLVEIRKDLQGPNALPHDSNDWSRNAVAYFVKEKPWKIFGIGIQGAVKHKKMLGWSCSRMYYVDLVYYHVMM